MFKICWLHSSCFCQGASFVKFSSFLEKRHPNMKFMIEKQINHSLAFFNVFLSGVYNQNLTLQTYHKWTYTGFILNFKSFTSLSYNISLTQCLIDRLIKVSNNWNSFHNNIENIKSKHYFKLPYIGNHSHHIKKNYRNFANSFVKKF